MNKDEKLLDTFCDPVQEKLQIIENLHSQITNLISDIAYYDDSLEEQCRKYGLLEEIEKKEEELAKIGAGGSALSVIDKAEILGNEIGRLRNKLQLLTSFDDTIVERKVEVSIENGPFSEISVEHFRLFWNEYESRKPTQKDYDTWLSNKIRDYNVPRFIKLSIK